MNTCAFSFCPEAYATSSTSAEDNALEPSRFDVGQWPCALDGYVSRIHDANSSLIGHRHDPRPSCAHARSAVRAVDFNNPYACTRSSIPRAFTPGHSTTRGSSRHICRIQILKRR